MDGKTKIDETALKVRFAASADLQSEFGGDVKAYIAFKLAESQGRIRGLKSNVPVHTSSAEPGPGPAAVDEAELKKEFSAMSADQQAEFGDVESYISYKIADAKGQVRYAPRNKTEKLGKGLPISEEVHETFVEAARISEAINKKRDEELRQYQNGIPCDANGVPCES